MHIHILGICGTFMGGLAQLAVAAGHQVSGCDANVYPPMSEQLITAGIGLHEGYDADQIAIGPDLFIVGNVVTRGNPLLEAILNQGLPFCSGPQWLSEHILHNRWVLGVAGTHGKTTTSAMLAWILHKAGLNPGFLIGGVPFNFGISARLGNVSSSPLFVVEADEYDSAFNDKRSKFIHYRPRTLILNSLEYDHADIFPNLAAIEQQFHHLVRSLPGNGLIVCNAQEPSLKQMLKHGCWTPVTYANDPGGIRLEGDDATGALRLYDGEKMMTKAVWTLNGEHNRANACHALLAARHAGVSVSTGMAALESFQNVKRRLELRGIANGVSVYDDFAHHPTAIAATLTGLRNKSGLKRILAVLEPHSNTMKAGVMRKRLPSSLSAADRVYCYSAEANWDVTAALAPLGTKASVHDDFESLLTAITHTAREGDLVLVMSNGDFQNIHQRLLEKLASPTEPRLLQPENA